MSPKINTHDPARHSTGTLAGRLSAGLDKIVALMDELLDASTIDYVPNRLQRFAEQTGIAIVALVADAQWGGLDDRQSQFQRQILESWNPWLEQVHLLFSSDTDQRQRELGQAASKVALWIQRDANDFTVPPTLQEAKKTFRAHVAPFFAALRSLGDGGRVVVVPDTNVLVRTPDVTTYGDVLAARAYTVALVPGVLAEVDEQKVNHRNPAYRERAMSVSRRIKGWRNQGNLNDGVRVQGDVWVRTEGREPDFEKTLPWLQRDVMDDRIIASVLELQRRCPTDRVVLLTGDIIMQTKADTASIPTTDTPEPEPDP